jgi:CheY-like chemotaxis protein
VRLRLDPGLGRIRADPGQIDQVILNLAVNARDAMPDGGVLTFETSNVGGDPPGGARVRLVVRDTGIGMSPEVQARIFEPFFTTKEQGLGSGLGLPAVHGIVTQSGGEVRVTSAPGLGATFEVFLPQTGDAEPADPPIAPPVVVKGGTETILLAEDEAALRGLIADVLEFRGYTVLAADGAAQALGRAGAHGGPIHLLITDLMMPGETGRELAEGLRPSRPDLRVLYISGYSNDDAIRRGLLADGVDLLEKPFTTGQLLGRIRGILDAPARL